MRHMSKERQNFSPFAPKNFPDDVRLRTACKPSHGATLTPREREVVKLIADGNSVRRIASLLGLSIKTVEAHKLNLMRKLDIHNKAQLVIYAIQKKIAKMPTWAE